MAIKTPVTPAVELSDAAYDEAFLIKLLQLGDPAFMQD